MRTGLRILISDVTTLSADQTWGDIIDNWEAYAREWNAVNALTVAQGEAPILDMFGDEGVSIKRMVKDLSDPKKLFTDYSRSFRVPASKKNNLIFQHYYNVEIQNGLDTRELLPCRLLLNNTTYQVGNMSIEGVDMSDGVPTAYKVRFIGKTSELAKKIGSDELSSLDFSNLNNDNFNPKGEFQANGANDLVFPLASRSDQFTIDSGTASLGIDNVRNIRYSIATASADYGLKEQDIVGAMKVGTILNAIALKYGISFSGVFTRDYITSMYLWLQKAKKKENEEGYSALAQALTPLTAPANTSGKVIPSAGGVEVTGYAQGRGFEILAAATWTGGGSVHLLKNGEEVASTSISGANTGSTWVAGHNTGTGTVTIGGGFYSVEVRTATSQTVSASITVNVYDWTYVQGELRPEYVFSNGSTYTDSAIDIGDYLKYYISEHIPKMKVMDFLSVLFKMFNVVATVDDQNAVSTRHFDAFMSEGVTYDVTPYVDQSRYSVDKPNLYSSLLLDFEAPKTALEQAYQQVNAKNYGELNYQLIGDTGDKLSGAEYNLHIPSQRIPVERMFNINGAVNAFVDLGYCLFADLKGAEQTIKPAFTYIASMTNHIGLAWNDGATVTQIDDYVLPCSIYNNAVLPNAVDKGRLGLFFGEEVNEYQTNTLVQGHGLFNNFFKGMASLMFDEDTRKVKFRAELPQRILLKLKLSDVLEISGKYYQINAIETNYLTGWSELDLTLTGRSKLFYFQKKSYSVANTGGSSLKVTYMSHNGFLVQAVITSGSSSTINCIGEITTFSNIYYTVTEL